MVEQQGSESPQEKVRKRTIVIRGRSTTMRDPDMSVRFDPKSPAPDPDKLLEAIKGDLEFVAPGKRHIPKAARKNPKIR